MPRLRSFPLLLVLTIHACSRGAPAGDSQTPSLDARRIPVRADRLTETSGAAMGRSQPGIVFTINDSGNEDEIYAIDTTGAPRGRWKVADARNVDWEAMASGSCGGADTLCLYVADVGDNSARRRALTIYRVREPTVGDDRTSGRLPSERLLVRYETGPRDVEAMYVAPNGTIYLITKRAERGLGGALRPALVMAVDRPAWGAGDTATAKVVDSLPIVPGSAVMRTITDAALSPDGRAVAVRTYTEVYVFVTDASGRIDTRVAPTVCDVSTLNEPGGEAVTWYGTTGKLLLLSEGRRQPMHVVGCAPPRRSE